MARMTMRIPVKRCSRRQSPGRFFPRTRFIRKPSRCLRLPRKRRRRRSRFVPSDDAIELSHHHTIRPGIANRPTRIFAAGAVVCALLLFLLSGGCKPSKPGRLSPARIHQITQGLARAAADAASKDSVVKSRRARGRSAGGRAEGKYVWVGGAGAKTQILKQKLEEIATRHGLAVTSEELNKGGVQITLRSRGVLTHRIEIQQLAPAANQTSAPPGNAPH